MRFLWPPMLWLLALVPALVAAYLVVLRRRKTQLRGIAGLRMVDEALASSRLWQRHVPAVLLLAGVTLMLLAAARPEAVLSLPLHEETVILAIDVSGSMRATDIYPDRLAVAQAAAKQFIAAKASTTRVGIVEFAGTALLVQGPTTASEDLVAVIDSLEPKDATAIILLTDGENTVGPEPLHAAKLAARQGVRIYTVGLGTDHGDFIGNGLWAERVRLDEPALREIAELTGGEYFHAESLLELTGIYDVLRSELAIASRRWELTLPLSASAALTLLIGAALSLLWFNRIL